MEPSNQHLLMTPTATAATQIPPPADTIGVALVPLHVDQRGKLMLSYNIDRPSIACEHYCRRYPLDAPFRNWKCPDKLKQTRLTEP